MKITVPLTTEDLCPCRSAGMEERWGPSSCRSPASYRQRGLSPSSARHRRVPNPLVLWPPPIAACTAVPKEVFSRAR